MKKILIALAVGLFLSSSSLPANAAYTCGIYMRSITGHKYGPAFNLARNWAKLPHTSASPGAVVVQSRAGRALGGGPGGHVSMIRQVLGNCRALVQDNRGSYVRNICKNLIAYVRP